MEVRRPRMAITEGRTTIDYIAVPTRTTTSPMGCTQSVPLSLYALGKETVWLAVPVCEPPICRSLLVYESVPQPGERRMKHTQGGGSCLF